MWKKENKDKHKHTTEEVKNALHPSGSKVVSTKESSDKAYVEQKERLEVTKQFKEKYSVSNIPTIKIPTVEDKIKVPLAELVSIVENTTHTVEMAMEIEKALLRIRKVENDLAD